MESYLFKLTHLLSHQELSISTFGWKQIYIFSSSSFSFPLPKLPSRFTSFQLKPTRLICKESFLFDIYTVFTFRYLCRIGRWMSHRISVETGLWKDEKALTMTSLRMVHRLGASFYTPLITSSPPIHQAQFPIKNRVIGGFNWSTKPPVNKLHSFNPSRQIQWTPLQTFIKRYWWIPFKAVSLLVDARRSSSTWANPHR